MDGGGGGDKCDQEQDRKVQEVEDDTMDDLLRDRFRLTAISIAEAEAKKNGMDVAGPVVACMADLAFKYAENLAKDLEVFAHHAGRKTVNMDDVILSGAKNANQFEAINPSPPQSSSSSQAATLDLASPEHICSPYFLRSGDQPGLIIVC